jgi:hypothetical protein
LAKKARLSTVRRRFVIAVNIAMGLAAACFLAVVITGVGVGPSSGSTRQPGASLVEPTDAPSSSTPPASTSVTTPATVPAQTTPPAATSPSTQPPVAPTATTPGATTPTSALGPIVPAPAPSSPPTYRYNYTPATVPAPTAPPTVAPSTTIAPLGNRLPVSPSTLPFATKAQNAHVAPVFAALSGGGFFVALVIVGICFVRSRSPR